MNAATDAPVDDEAAGGAEPPAGADAAAPDAAPGVDTSFGAVFAAGAGLVEALRRSAATLAALCVAEARLLRASVGVVIVGALALVAVAVSLWACVVALLGWALAVATGSIGIALAILVALHAALAVALWLVLARTLRAASFPATRAELAALGDGLRAHAARAQGAPPAHDEASP